MTTLTETEAQVVVNSGIVDIDIALWVLIQHGLHASPFDKHTQLNGILQDNGIDASTWYGWLKLILINQDDRLSWHVDNIQEEAHRRTESDRLKQTLTNDNNFFDELWHSSREREHRNQLQMQEQNYREAIADYPGLDVATIYNSTPPQLWQSNQQSQAIINQMWDEFNVNYRSNSHIDNYFTSNIMEQMQSQTEIDNIASGYRKIYLTPYVAEVELIVPPITIIITVKDTPINAQQLNQRMINTVRKLEAS